MSSNGKPWLNASGYPDPTAHEAVNRIQMVDDAAHKVIGAIRTILDLSGFELIGRIQIRHKRSGKIYR